jgi:hypothetical protein
MDPYLEQPSLWPDVHSRLIVALADVLAPMVSPRYYVAVEERVYLAQPEERRLVGQPDVALVGAGATATATMPVARIVERCDA